MPLRVLDEFNFGPLSALVSALDYVITLPDIDIVSMSLINYPLDPMIANSLQATPLSS